MQSVPPSHLHLLADAEEVNPIKTHPVSRQTPQTKRTKLEAQITDLRAVLDDQQAEISALRQELAYYCALRQMPMDSANPPSLVAPATATELLVEAPWGVEPVTEPMGAPASAAQGTSRRGLLRGAAAATAAAVVATVAAGGVQSTHAAPLATGGDFILGADNDAGATTILHPTDAAAPPSPVLQVTTTGANTTFFSAIHGHAPNGAVGVKGDAGGSGVGVKGDGGISGTGVYGIAGGASGGSFAPSAIGVWGGSRYGWGVIGESGEAIDLAATGTGRIYQRPQSLPGIPTGYFSRGESIRDANGDLWLCTVGDGSNGGTWVKVAHLAPGATSGGAVTYLSIPIRLLDTRPGQPAAFVPGAPYLANSTHTIQVAGVNFNMTQVPASCVGAIGNLTVIGRSGAGNYVELTPAGAGFAGTSNLNFVAGQLVSNSYNVGLNVNGALDIILGSGGDADVILDLYAVIA